MAYMPIMDILRSYFDIKEGDRESVIKKKIEDRITQLDKNLKVTLPPLHDLLSLKVEDEAYLRLEPKQKRDLSFEAIRDMLVRESQNKPLVLSVEDLHWIDKTSEEFLDFLIGSLANAKILLILLYRSEYTNPWGSKSYYNRIGLDQLSTKSSTELVHAILEGGEVVPELRELILGRAGGNPLFVEELTQSLLENGTIQRKDHQYVLTRAASEIQVPDTIQGIIAARIDRMEDSLKRIMQVASVIGRDFAYRILQTITGMRDELKSYLLNLQDLEFIYEKRLFPELEYIFKHALTQEVAYNSLLLKRRKKIHEKIGRAIEEIYIERLEEFYEMLAYHYSKSKMLEKAYQYLKLSGNKATRNYSNWEAFRFFKDAINVLIKMPETEENKREQLEVLFLTTLPMFSLGFPEGSLEILQEGVRLSKELEEEKSLAHFQVLVGIDYALKGEDLLPRLQYLEDSFKEAEKTNNIELIAPIGLLLCTIYWWIGECFKIIDMASKVIALLDKTQRQSESFGRPGNPYSSLHAKYAGSMGILGNFEEGKVMLEKGIDFAHKIKNLFALGQLELDYGTLQNIKGDGENAIEHLQNCIRYCEEGQIVILLGQAWSRLGWGYCLQGDLETARKHMENGLKIHSDAGLQYHLSLQYGLLGMVHLESGDLKNAQSCAEEALKLSQKNHEKWAEGFIWILLGRIFGKARKSQDDKAEECILQGIKILNELQLKPLYAQGYHFLGELYTNTGQQNKAMKNLLKAEGMFREMGMDYWLARRQETIERL
jgi:tetratricopeptide (TPR) repeat protein